MRAGARLVAFVSTADLDRARAFYADTLGLAEVEVTPFAAVYDSGGTHLRVTAAGEITVAPYTVLGWIVADIDAEIDALESSVSFRIFDGMGQDDRGVWTAPDGSQVAWFADPDGHLLSLTQAP